MYLYIYTTINERREAGLETDIVGVKEDDHEVCICVNMYVCTYVCIYMYKCRYTCMYIYIRLSMSGEKRG
jgi:hypothetical protein